MITEWQRWRRWRPVLLGMAFALTVVLSNCGRSPNATNSPQANSPASGEQTALVFGLGGEPANLEPGNITDNNSIYVHEQIYDRLINFQPGTTELEPGLATEWSASDDGLTWTFTLREGVTFHDGTPFNAEAVKTNVERWWDPASPTGYRDAGRGYEIWPGLFGGFKGDEASTVQAVNAVDDTTIEFVLNQPFAAFPAAIGSGYFGIASPAAIEEAGTAYGTAGSTAVGTGPYTLQEWRSGDRIILAANPDYWGEAPQEEQLVVRFITDPSARLAELRAGAIDFTVELAPDQMPEIRSDSNLEPVLRESLNVGYFALNTSYEPLADARVRRAIALAINREEIVEAFWGDLGQTDPHFLPPSMDNFNDKSLSAYEYNPDEAKQLLAEAGYANGFPLELWYMPVSRPYFPTPKPIAEAFAADLSEIGITITFNTKDWATYIEDSKKAPGYQSFMLGWTGDYGDPDNFYYYHFGPGGTSDLGNWKNDRVIQLLNEARATDDQGERETMYAEVDKILYDEVVRIPIVHSQPLLAQRTNISGWQPSPLGSEPFNLISKD
ncbi:ABC transporter substrate-binding protein [Oculatella sp. LEGE 06141]|uniref:ABC transporter substrate-binding protein n=1 Tax=Oculatella sp. LEGE 06141 TaxID=1828648 RepID=UPI00187F48B0|nr:ABC transporter substrate-binding protein [Oculatella sp. LEGE 06141]MBE9177006.1 ABC transporter substrate-binding protein [Oculatella sp. LEGE 06141]